MKKSRSRAQERRFWGKIFTFPSFIVVCLFAFYPVFRTLYLSFCEYNFGFDASPVFIGVENYVRMFSDAGEHRKLCRHRFYPDVGALACHRAVVVL